MYGKSQEFYGKFMDMYGHAWTCMEKPKFMKIYGNAWTCMERLWKCIGKSMEVYGNVLKI